MKPPYVTIHHPALVGKVPTRITLEQIEQVGCEYQRKSDTELAAVGGRQIPR